MNHSQNIAISSDLLLVAISRFRPGLDNRLEVRIRSENTFDSVRGICTLDSRNVQQSCQNIWHCRQIQPLLSLVFVDSRNCIANLSATTLKTLLKVVDFEPSAPPPIEKEKKKAEKAFLNDIISQKLCVHGRGIAGAPRHPPDRILDVAS